MLSGMTTHRPSGIPRASILVADRFLVGVPGVPLVRIDFDAAPSLGAIMGRWQVVAYIDRGLVGKPYTSEEPQLPRFQPITMKVRETDEIVRVSDHLA